MHDKESTGYRDRSAIWHPFTQMKTAPDPLVITSGKGSLLVDEKGDEYIDAISSWWVNLHGHAHPYITKAINRQLETLHHVHFAGVTHEPAVRLAERILAHLPATHSKIFYSDNGSTAVEVAVKMAVQYWHNLGEKRKKLLTFRNGYFGDTFGAMAVGERGTFVEPFRDLLFEVEQVPTPSVAGSEISAQVEEIVSAGDIAALIYEPLVQGAGGMRIYSRAGLEEIIAICRRHGVLIIADEVMTGFYRTGTFLASDQISEKPDFICLSKGLSGGTLPLAMTSCTEEIFDGFYFDQTDRAFLHGHSFTANPIACAAGLASLDITESSECAERVKAIAESHRHFLDKIASFATVANPRMAGTILAFDLVGSEGTSYFNTMRSRLYDFFISRKVILRPLGNVIYILPPYCTTPAQLNRVYDVVVECLESFA